VADKSSDAKTSIRVLLLEDEQTHAELALRELKRAGLRIESRVASTELGFLKDLAEFSPDVILSDFSMPGFDGMYALSLARVRCPEIPFIFVSGTIGEEYAVRALQNGATDYVLKANLIRLPAAVERALQDARERRQMQHVERALQESEAGLRRAQVVAGLAHVITGASGKFESWSDSLPPMIGIKPADMPRSTREWLALLHPEDRAAFRAKAIAGGRSGTRIEVEYRLKSRDGSWIDIRQVSEPLGDARDADGTRRWFGTLQDVSAQKQVAGALRVSEERYRTTFEQAAVGVVHASFDGDLLMVNRHFCEMVGYSRAEVVQLNVRDLMHAGDAEQSAAARARLLAEPDRPHERELRLVRKDGTQLWVNVTTSLVRGADGKPVHFVSVLNDVTERRLAALQLSESEARFRSLSQLSSDWFWQTDAEHRFVDTPATVTALTGKRANAYVGKRRWDVDGLAPVIGDWSAHQQVLERRETFRDFELVQLRADGEKVHLQVSGEPIFDIEGRFQGYRGTAKDITAQRRGEEELRRFRLALDSSADIIFIIDRSTMRHMDVNQGACRLLGYSREELLRMGPSDLLPMSQGELEKKYDDLIANPAQRSGMQSYYRCKDGSQLPFESTRHVLRSGDSWLIAVISRDIRERLAAETALRESEERFRSLSELSSDWFWQQDAEYRFVDFSGGEGVGGWGRDQSSARGLRRWELPGVVPISGSWDEHKATLQARKPYRDFEYQRLLGDGSLQYVSASGEPLFDADGKFAGYRGVASDITERKRADHELQRFRMAMDVSADSIYLTDLEAMRFVYVNDAACQRLGYARERLLQLGPQDVLPGSLEQIKREYDKVVLAGEKGVVQERPFARKDGSEGWTELHRRVLQVGGGMLMVTIGRDVTERRQAEEKVRRLNRVYAMLSGINALIVRVRDRDELFGGACRIAVEQAGFPLAWIGTLDADSQELRAAAMAGTVLDYAKLLQPSVRTDIPAGQGTNGRAFRERKPVVDNDMAANPNAGYMRKEGLKLGIRAALSLPLLVEGAPVGVLALYAKEKDYFDDEEVTLLTRLASDISFALDHLNKAEQLQIEATQRLRAEAKVTHLNRVYAVLSGINATVIRVHTKEELFKEACRVAVENGQFRMAWLGTVDREAMLIRPIAWQGADADYIRKMPLGLDDTGSEIRGLAGRAVRERKAVVVDDMTQDPRILLKTEASERGFHSLVMLPLIVADEVVSVLALYASEIGFFDEEEMKLLRELAGDIAFALDHIEKQEKLDYLAYYDQLTGLASRALFLERASQSIGAAAAQADGKLALAILDVERLRAINESLGRQAGDVLIKLVAERLKTVAGPGGVSRVSADHFALVLGTVKGRSEAGRLVTEALQRSFSAPFLVGDTELRMSARVGVALYPSDGTEAEVLLRNAEAALRKGKDGGEQITFHAPEMTARVAENLALENKLRRALEKQEFVLHYQPKVDLETRRVVGVEGLIRWNNPERGLVPPGQFIPLLEETGMILRVGAWALERAVLDHGHWLRQGVPAPRIAVNVSAIQLRQRDFVDVVKEAIARGANPTAIDIEITESLLMEDVAENIRKLKALRDLGIKLSIDDFGTGYSSLGYLAKLPVHTLKIDRSFIVTMLSDPDTMTLVSTIISLAHSLRLNVVAEGVEQEDQAKLLRLLRCDQIQGYLISRPLPMEDLTPLLLEKK
jgi:PAS domain S-box-containing protein/diguanylate cyclase (GGDEF)-like protein